MNFKHFSGYKYKIRLVSILRKREDQALISISTILKFSALYNFKMNFQVFYWTYLLSVYKLSFCFICIQYTSKRLNQRVNTFNGNLNYPRKSYISLLLKIWDRLKRRHLKLISNYTLRYFLLKMLLFYGPLFKKIALIFDLTSLFNYSIDLIDWSIDPLIDWLIYLFRWTRMRNLPWILNWRIILKKNFVNTRNWTHSSSAVHTLYTLYKNWTHFSSAELYTLYTLYIRTEHTVVVLSSTHFIHFI